MLPVEPPLPITSVPLWTWIVPVEVSAPAMTKLRLLTIVRSPGPLIGPLNVV